MAAVVAAEGRGEKEVAGVIQEDTREVETEEKGEMSTMVAAGVGVRGGW